MMAETEKPKVLTAADIQPGDVFTIGNSGTRWLASAVDDRVVLKPERFTKKAK